MKKQVVKTMILSIFVYIVTYCINFFITPFVSAALPGTYGYVKLANDFISYVSLVTISLNSMSGRFISLEYNNGNIEKANKYYSSVLFANIAIVAICLLPLSFFVLFLERFIDVADNVLFDVKLLFVFTFASFLLSIVFSVNSLATFVKNRLDYTYYVEFFGCIIRLVLLILLFSLFPSNVFYIGLTGFVVTIFTVISNQIIKNKILPEFTLKKEYIKLKLVVELVASGIWNTIQKLGQILLDGLDIIISNIFINSAAMNDLSFAKTMPSIIAALLNKIASVFAPNYTILYAKGKMTDLRNEVKQSMLILSIFISIPVGIIMAMGNEFYMLWLPNENTNLIYKLSTLSCIIYIVSTPMNAVYNLFTITNKVKILALITVGSGLISTLAVFLLLKFTNIGIYAIVCCSVVIGIIRNFCFVAPYAAKMLNFKWWIFFPEMAKSAVSVIIVGVISLLVKSILSVETWTTFFIAIVIVGLLSLSLNILILLNKSQKAYLKGFLKRKVNKNAK